jgi:dihydroorotate dehydrogenase
MRALYPHADYLTLNLSSPNTPGLRTLQSESALAPLLEGVRETQAGLEARHGRRVPLLLKIAPDLAPDDVGIVAGAVVRCGIDGVIATNTTIDRPGLHANGSGTAGVPPPAAVVANAVASEAGGLSGAPLHPLALATVARLRAALGPDVPVIGVGGIMSRADGEAMLAHGADLLQIYTGFIYRGPKLLRDLTQL